MLLPFGSFQTQICFTYLHPDLQLYRGSMSPAAQNPNILVIWSLPIFPTHLPSFLDAQAEAGQKPHWSWFWVTYAECSYMLLTWPHPSDVNTIFSDLLGRAFLQYTSNQRCFSLWSLSWMIQAVFVISSVSTQILGVLF